MFINVHVIKTIDDLNGKIFFVLDWKWKQLRRCFNVGEKPQLLLQVPSFSKL